MIKEFQKYANYWLNENWKNVYSIIDSFIEENNLDYNKYYLVLDKELEKIIKKLQINY